jgi:hypothetical protein
VPLITLLITNGRNGHLVPALLHPPGALTLSRPNPAPPCCKSHGPGHEGARTCGSFIPVVTVLPVRSITMDEERSR